MNMQPARVARLRHVLVAVFGGVALWFGSAHASAVADVGLSGELDAVFAAARWAFASADGATDVVDLHDGLAPVPARWQANFEGFAQDDRAHAPALGGVVFVGSSSISFWSDLQAEFPGHNVIPRGLAGATMADCAHDADRLILRYRPRVVVVYAGDNDLAAGATPEQVVADYARLVQHVHLELPATRIVFVSIKPSPSRAALMPLVVQTNALMAAYAQAGRHLSFVDIFTAMLDRDHQPRRELFRADGLHMNAAGYALWREALADHLD